jgi:hypothetical protein
MTERFVGLRSELVIWAVAEARRRRRQAIPVDERDVRTAGVAPAAPEVELSVPPEVRDLVVDWQLLAAPAHDSHP